MRISTNGVLSFFLVAMLSAAPLYARELPMFYSRANVTLVRTHLPEPPAPALPWQDVVKENPEVTLDVEVRDATTLTKQKGWFNLSSLSDKKGVMAVFATESLSPIGASSQYAKLDILLADREGKITQIIPNISLAELEQDIYPASPVLAYLFLKGGTCERLSIAPGDFLEHTLFKKPPTVLSAPALPQMPAPMPKETKEPVKPAVALPPVQIIGSPENQPPHKKR